MNIDIDALAKRVARLMCPDALLTADEVGSMLGGYAGRYVREVLAKAEGFPKPVRLPLPDGKMGDARWKRGDITSYVSKLGSPSKPGRPRKAVVSL